MVTFDGNTRVITATQDQLRVEEIYSRWKEWSQSNSGYVSAFSVVGGDPLPGNRRISAYFFLTNGWRLKPQEKNHTFIIDGSLLTDTGDDPVIKTTGNYQVVVQMQLPIKAETVVSNSVDNQKLNEIHAAHYNRRTLTDNIITLYQSDGVTPLKTFTTNSDMSDITPQ